MKHKNRTWYNDRAKAGQGTLATSWFTPGSAWFKPPKAEPTLTKPPVKTTSLIQAEPARTILRALRDGARLILAASGKWQLHRLSKNNRLLKENVKAKWVNILAEANCLKKRFGKTIEMVLPQNSKRAMSDTLFALSQKSIMKVAL